ncbi:DUF3291 domain-containing protein [Streptomyces sp. NPDC057638]|uniref:DUF3291 domain-containing protein n=1 Tax=Streptomyces sp. NPDC057638 TaxID=3346190 RepID=UPI00368E0B16
MIPYQLAQVNIARMIHPLDSPEMKDFTDALDPVNAVADASDGFVWRLTGGEGDATDQRIFEDDWILVNMSVWRDADALKAFMYAGLHRELLRRRHDFFARVQEAMSTLWWVEPGHRPTVKEAEERLLLLREKGPTEEAFTLGRLFPPPSAP